VRKRNASQRGAGAAGRGAFKTRCEMKLPWMDPRLRELVALGVLAALGCGLALSQGDLLFAAIFGVACAVTIIEAIRRLR
jgi:alkylhydroperoxidase/carboxymuconolactone decarboxylase family protein YurZ